MKTFKHGGRASFPLIKRYCRLCADLRSRHKSVRRSAQRLLALSICVPLIALSLIYIVSWELDRRKILRDNAAFSALYSPESPVASSSPAHSPAPSLAAAATPSSTPASTPSPQPSWTPAPSPSPTPAPFEIAVDATREPLATPDSETLIYTLQSPPPAQRSFADLLALNPETVGFLKVEDAVSLPVVQRKNDNQYYLAHSFNGEDSAAGTVFLDGSNLLVPEDDVLILYGHNMRNGTMFRPLTAYEDWDFLVSHPLIRFDTLYENRYYLPFAVLSVTADPDSERFVDLRQFSFDDDSFDAYVKRLRELSIWEIPVEVCRGDSLLLLVTCEYTHDNGRFVVALRALRPGENTQDAAIRIQNTKAK